MRAADSKFAARATWLATRITGSISPRLAGPFADRLWFTPWRVPPGERGLARQAEWLKDTEPLTFPAGRYRVAGFSAGSGPVVVLVHGWGERAASLGGFIAPLVAAGYRVVGVDMPGHGGSSGGRTDGFELAGALRAVCDSLGDVHAVVGHSMGGMIATYATHEGLRTDRLVLLAPSVHLDRALETFATLLKLPHGAVAGLKARIDRRYGPEVWQRFSGVRVAPSIEVPALIVHDREDPQVAFEDAEALHGAWPNSRLVVTEGLGHTRMLRDAKVIEEVTSFLSDVRGRVAAQA